MNSRRVVFGSLCVVVTSGLIALPSAQPVDHPLLEGVAWRPIGPTNMGGRVDDVEAVESDPSTIYVGAATSGVWKTDNNGTTWMPVFDAQPNLSIGDIAIAPSNPNVVWVGTGEANQRQSTSYGGGVFKSVDAGKTWTFMGLRDSGTVGRILIDPKNPDVVYVAAGGDLFKAHPERGLYKTSDGGRTWTKSKFIDDDTGFIDVVMDPSNSQTLIAASYQRRRTAWGFNGGGPGSALWKTIDAGKTWKRIDGGGLPAYGRWGRVGLAFSRSNPNVVYAMIEPGPQAGGGGEEGGRAARSADLDPNRAGIWRSDDKGATWKLTSNDNGRAMYFSQIRVDPKDPNTVFALERTLYKSTDGARTFKTTPGGRAACDCRIRSRRLRRSSRRSTASRIDVLPPSHPDHHAMWIDPANPKHIILGHDGGVDFSYDGGRSWQLQNCDADGAVLPGRRRHAAAVLGVRRRAGQRRLGRTEPRPQQRRHYEGTLVRTRRRRRLSRRRRSHRSGQSSTCRCPATAGSICGGRISEPASRNTFARHRRVAPGDTAKPDGAFRPPATSSTPLQPNEAMRYNWNPGFAMSPHDPRTLYFGANRLFISHDRGDSWTRDDRSDEGAQPRHAVDHGRQRRRADDRQERRRRLVGHHRRRR